MSIIESKSQLINYFNQGAKQKDKLLIGVEHEKFLFTGKKKKTSKLQTNFKNF